LLAAVGAIITRRWFRKEVRILQSIGSSVDDPA